VLHSGRHSQSKIDYFKPIFSLFPSLNKKGATTAYCKKSAVVMYKMKSDISVIYIPFIHQLMSIPFIHILDGCGCLLCINVESDFNSKFIKLPVESLKLGNTDIVYV
jgi:hypothetical protein